MDSERLPGHKEVIGGMESEVNKGGTLDYARIKMDSGDRDQMSQVDASQLEQHMEPPTSHLHGKIGLD